MSEQLVDFCWRVYACPEVAEASLCLQDQQGCDVNMLLSAVWLGLQRRTWAPQQVLLLLNACRPWRQQVLVPLRRTRRRFKRSRPEFYAQLKALELSAEQFQLDYLQGELARQTLGQGPQAVRRNLEVYRSVLGEDHAWEPWQRFLSAVSNTHTGPEPGMS